MIPHQSAASTALLPGHVPPALPQSFAVEQRLVKAARQGDRHALHRLIERHRRQLHGLAQEFTWPQVVEHDDLVQESMIRFIEIVCTSEGPSAFDPDRGTPLWTYAYRAVRWHLIEFTRRVTGIPKRVLARRSRVLQTSATLHAELGRSPSIHELATRTELTPKLVEEVLRINTREVALEAVPEPETPPDEEGSGLSLIPFYQVLTTILHPAVAQKFMVLLVLNTLQKISLKTITMYVLDEQAPIGKRTLESPAPWASWHITYDLPTAIPPDWAVVVALFGRGVPRLHTATSQSPAETQAEAQQKSYAGLRKFYRRTHGKLEALGLTSFRKRRDVIAA